MNPSNPVKTEKTHGRITSEQEINPVQIPHPFNATFKFPPPWARCTVKCPGYARGGCWSFELISALGHEKKSQRVLIKSVILRQSFLSAMKRIISTRAVGMCPCGYFQTAWQTLRLWEKPSRREAKILTGKNECSQRKSGNVKVGMSDFRVTSFWLCRMLATQRA